MNSAYCETLYVFKTENGYTELQGSTNDQNRPYQSLTNSNNKGSTPKVHQYEEVQSDKGTHYSCTYMSHTDVKLMISSYNCCYRRKLF